jgi:hypothetical protein
LSEQNHRPKGRVGRNASDQLIGAGPVNHLLDDEPVCTEYLIQHGRGEQTGYTGGWGHFHIPDDLFLDLRAYRAPFCASYRLSL